MTGREYSLLPSPSLPLHQQHLGFGRVLHLPSTSQHCTDAPSLQAEKVARVSERVEPSVTARFFVTTSKVSQSLRSVVSRVVVVSSVSQPVSSSSTLFTPSTVSNASKQWSTRKPVVFSRPSLKVSFAMQSHTQNTPSARLSPLSMLSTPWSDKAALCTVSVVRWGWVFTVLQCLLWNSSTAWGLEDGCFGMGLTCWLRCLLYHKEYGVLWHGW